jgi:hypothetical protein
MDKANRTAETVQDSASSRRKPAQKGAIRCKMAQSPQISAHRLKRRKPVQTAQSEKKRLKRHRAVRLGQTPPHDVKRCQTAQTDANGANGAHRRKRMYHDALGAKLQNCTNHHGANGTERQKLLLTVHLGDGVASSAKQRNTMQVTQTAQHGTQACMCKQSAQTAPARCKQTTQIVQQGTEQHNAAQTAQGSAEARACKWPNCEVPQSCATLHTQPARTVQSKLRKTMPNGGNRRANGTKRGP